MFEKQTTLWSGFAALAVAVLFLAAACERTPVVRRGTTAAPTPADGWQALLQTEASITDLRPRPPGCE